MKNERDYNLPLAVLYFLQQKVKETSLFWVYLGILGVMEFVAHDQDLKCNACSPWGDFVLTKLLVLPGVAFILFFLGVGAWLLLRDVWEWLGDLQRRLSQWLTENWKLAKERARK